jgi:hypothetical protein
MDQDTVDLVRQAINSKPDEFRGTFSDIMNNKVSNAVEIKYDQMFSNYEQETEVEDESEALEPEGE